MRKDNRLPSQAKGVYRVTNWPEYNAGLIERGNVTIWLCRIKQSSKKILNEINVI